MSDDITTHDELFPVFDTYDRLIKSGYRPMLDVSTEQTWRLYDKDGTLIISGKTFRDLCVNIVLMGL